MGEGREDEKEVRGEVIWGTGRLNEPGKKRRTRIGMMRMDSKVVEMMSKICAVLISESCGFILPRSKLSGQWGGNDRMQRPEDDYSEIGWYDGARNMT